MDQLVIFSNTWVDTVAWAESWNSLRKDQWIASIPPSWEVRRQAHSLIWSNKNVKLSLPTAVLYQRYGIKDWIATVIQPYNYRPHPCQCHIHCYPDPQKQPRGGQHVGEMQWVVGMPQSHNIRIQSKVWKFRLDSENLKKSEEFLEWNGCLSTASTVFCAEK